MYFIDVIFNFSKSLCVLHSTLSMTGELWSRRFIWHQDIRVNHCQSSAMSFIFTQYSFCNSFIHGLLFLSYCYWEMMGAVAGHWFIRYELSLTWLHCPVIYHLYWIDLHFTAMLFKKGKDGKPGQKTRWIFDCCKPICSCGNAKVLIIQLTNLLNHNWDG